MAPSPILRIVRKHPAAEIFVIETIGEDDTPNEVDLEKEYDAFDEIDDAVDAATPGASEVWVHADCYGPEDWRQFSQQFVGDDWLALPF